LSECEPGRFECSIVHAEVMHILRGAATFTPTDGTPVEFGAGDSLFFPANMIGAWDVTQTLRKLYVVLDPTARIRTQAGSKETEPRIRCLLRSINQDCRTPTPATI